MQWCGSGPPAPALLHHVLLVHLAVVSYQMGATAGLHKPSLQVRLQQDALGARRR